MMLRALFRAAPLPPRGTQTTTATRAGTWEDALKRLYNTQSSGAAPRYGFAQGRASAKALGHGGVRPGFFNSAQNVSRTAPRRGFRISSLWRSQGSNTEEKALSMGQKFRKLSREYGKAAVIVYFTLSILDYPLFFWLVRWAGTDRIGAIEQYVVSTFTSIIPETVRMETKKYYRQNREAVKKFFGHEEEKVAPGWGVEEADQRHREDASLGTQLALAYAVHKSFIFVRIPLTAAVTPKVVKTLRSWGWKIGNPRK